MEKFVITATQRSGTTFLESVLSTHTEIYCYPELLLWQNYQDQYNFFYFWLRKIKEQDIYVTPPYMVKAFQEFLDFIYSSRTDKRAVSIDIKYDQFTIIPNQILSLQKVCNKILHLVRKNVLKTYISQELNKLQAQLNRKAHGTKNVTPVKVNIPANDELIKELNRRKDEILSVKKYFSQNFQYLEVYYEDFFDTLESESQTISPEVLDKIYDFLNINTRQYNLMSNLKKTNPPKLYDLIQNYNEVRTFLEKNGWGYLFEEERLCIS